MALLDMAHSGVVLLHSCTMALARLLAEAPYSLLSSAALSTISGECWFAGHHQSSIWREETLQALLFAHPCVSLHAAVW